MSIRVPLANRRVEETGGTRPNLLSGQQSTAQINTKPLDDVADMAIGIAQDESKQLGEAVLKEYDLKVSQVRKEVLIEAKRFQGKEAAQGAVWAKMEFSNRVAQLRKDGISDTFYGTQADEIEAKWEADFDTTVFQHTTRELDKYKVTTALAHLDSTAARAGEFADISQFDEHLPELMTEAESTANMKQLGLDPKKVQSSSLLAAMAAFSDTQIQRGNTQQVRDVLSKHEADLLPEDRLKFHKTYDKAIKQTEIDEAVAGIRSLHPNDLTKGFEVLDKLGTGGKLTNEQVAKAKHDALTQARGDVAAKAMDADNRAQTFIKQFNDGSYDGAMRHVKNHESFFAEHPEARALIEAKDSNYQAWRTASRAEAIRRSQMSQAQQRQALDNLNPDLVRRQTGIYKGLSYLENVSRTGGPKTISEIESWNKNIAEMQALITQAKTNGLEIESVQDAQDRLSAIIQQKVSGGGSTKGGGTFARTQTSMLKEGINDDQETALLEFNSTLNPTSADEKPPVTPAHVSSLKQRIDDQLAATLKAAKDNGVTLTIDQMNGIRANLNRQFHNGLKDLTATVNMKKLSTDTAAKDYPIGSLLSFFEKYPNKRDGVNIFSGKVNDAATDKEAAAALLKLGRQEDARQIYRDNLAAAAENGKHLDADEQKEWAQLVTTAQLYGWDDMVEKYKARLTEQKPDETAEARATAEKILTRDY